MKRNKFHTESVLVLVLFAVLAVCVLTVLLTGAGAYDRLTKRGQEAYKTRTVPQYIATKVRQADVAGGIRLGQIDGVETLELHESIDGTRYVTRIYCYDGYVRELFSMADTVVEPIAGEPIMEAKELRFALEEGCLRIVVKQEDGLMTEQNLTLRSAEGGNLHEK